MDLTVDEMELIKVIRQAADKTSRESLTRNLTKLAHTFNTVFDDGRKYERSIKE